MSDLVTCQFQKIHHGLLKLSITVEDPRQTVHIETFSLTQGTLYEWELARPEATVQENTIMANFSSLPPEIHATIAKICDNNALINLCCTSKWVKESYLQALYRHVDLRPSERTFPTIPPSQTRWHIRSSDERKRLEQFVYALLRHPEHGKYVRSLKASLCLPKFRRPPESTVSDEEFWSVMRSLKIVQSVDMGSRGGMADNFLCRVKTPIQRLPEDLFNSATSVTLIGEMPYLLAKSILNSIDPATLKYLCLDMVREGRPPQISEPRGADDRRILKAFGATSDLLTTWTGRCTALRTLILRRLGQNHECSWNWQKYAEEDSYLEWASFIRSVQGTLEKFTFRHTERLSACELGTSKSLFRVMDERFGRLILPTIISGDWPCLTLIELIGVRSRNGPAGTAALTVGLGALLGAKAKIVIEEQVAAGG